MPIRAPAINRCIPGKRGFSPAPWLCLLALTGCGDKPQSNAESVQAPPPSVIAVPAKTEAVEEQATFVGRVVAIDKVDLRARVPGFLKSRAFTEGQTVQEGELLFDIEPDQYEAVVEQRQADLAKAKADQLNTAAQLNRGKALLKEKNIPQAKVDELQAADSIALASIQQAQAALNSAKLDLSYTKVTAPVAGRIGLAKYSVGNLVGPDSGPLATIVSSDPIYVQFPLTQRALLDARRDVQAKGGDPRQVVIQVRLPDGSLYDEPGSLNFVDVTTDAGTDTVTLRGELPNPNRLLVDGQYVGVLIQAGEPESAILIPQSALQVDQQGTFVLVIDGEQKAQIRRVQTGTVKGPLIVIRSGLKEGELVIAEGVQKVRPGQVVRASPPETFKAPDQLAKPPQDEAAEPKGVKRP
jgi:membrane fusion protein, multidrug efflux system